MNRKQLLIGAVLLVGIVTFFIGFGVELSDENLSAAKDAVNAGIEAIIAMLMSALSGLALTLKGGHDIPHP